MQSRTKLFSLLVMLTGVLFGQNLTRELTASELESLVIKQNPELKALANKIKATEGALLQSRLRLNPELELENGTGGDPEALFRLNQTFLTGGKRKKRSKIAELELEKTKMDYSLLKAQLIKGARAAFIDVLLYQEMVALYKEKVSVAKDFLTAIQLRVEAGRLSPAEESRARVALASSKIALNQANRTLRNHWKQLASFWGSTTTDYAIAVGELKSVEAPPTYQILSQSIAESPLLKQADIEVRIQQATVNLELANRIPDLTLGAGIRRTDVPDNTYEASLSIPIPIFNRNQGTVEKARALTGQALQEKAAREIQIQTLLSSIYTDLQVAYDETQALQTTILPEAENAYLIIRDGYLQGKFDYLDVIDAQNTLFEAKENWLEASSDYYKAYAELEWLLGQTLNSISGLSKE